MFGFIGNCYNSVLMIKLVVYTSGVGALWNAPRKRIVVKIL